MLAQASTTTLKTVIDTRVGFAFRFILFYVYEYFACMCTTRMPGQTEGVRSCGTEL